MCVCVYCVSISTQRILLFFVFLILFFYGQCLERRLNLSCSRAGTILHISWTLFSEDSVGIHIEGNCLLDNFHHLVSCYEYGFSSIHFIHCCVTTCRSLCCITTCRSLCCVTTCRSLCCMTTCRSLCCVTTCRSLCCVTTCRSLCCVTTCRSLCCVTTCRSLCCVTTCRSL